MSESIGNNTGQASTTNRRVRIFISSTFRDMMEERDDLMSHAWPELRRFCRERHVELVEVDMRWGISEEQSSRNETLKLCLDEIRSCWPYFIGLLGERYGWMPGDDAFTADLEEEQPWIAELHGKSVTELEILHGALNNPEMAGRAFFYFRDPAYSEDRGPDFQIEDAAASQKQGDLKERIRKISQSGQIQLCENYPDPAALPKLVLDHLKAVIDKQFPEEEVPDALDREAQSHESFAEIRRRTYIGREDYFKTLDRHAAGNGSPLVLLGDSGSGKSALLANWLEHWRREHTGDFIFQHYIGGTPDSADHWQLIKRLMSEIKKWCDDPDELPATHDDIVRDFQLWLAKAHLKAERDSVRCILVLDALNQLEDRDNSHLLGWLPPDAFRGSLRLIVSTLPGETLDAAYKFGWKSLHVEKLTENERRQMIVDYLKRFGKKLDTDRLNRNIAAPATANPLYLKILLDELRVTGTHDKLDERLNVYLNEPDVPSLLKNVLTRYQHHYERDRTGLVKEALGLIWSARRGLSEAELLQLLRPAGLGQLPPAIWTPLRAAMEELLIDCGGILNFAHDFLRTAVEEAFVPRREDQENFRLQLADYFESLPASARSCDELPWLLQQTKSLERLRACLLDIDCFLQIIERDQNELRNYWVELGEQAVMGKAYLESFERWLFQDDSEEADIAHAANAVACFLLSATLYTEAEPLLRRTLSINEKSLGMEPRNVALTLNNLAQLLQETNRLAEAEPLVRRALEINEHSFGKDHPRVAPSLMVLAFLLQTTNRLAEAETLVRRALEIDEHSFGKDHPRVALTLNNLAMLLQADNRHAEAEPLVRRALEIDEHSFGKDHPRVALTLNNLAMLLQTDNRYAEAEPLVRRALEINEHSFGKDHPRVALTLNSLASLLRDTNRLAEAEPLVRRALEINEHSFGKDHPHVAFSLNNLAQLLRGTSRLAEAEPLMRRALEIDEHSLGKDHPRVALELNNLAMLLQADNRYAEAEPLMRRALEINEHSLGKDHPRVAIELSNLAELLQATNRLAEAESLIRRALEIDEHSLGKDHPDVASDLNILAQSLQATNRLAEAEPLMRRHVEILLKFTRATGHLHPRLQAGVSSYARLLHQKGMPQAQVRERLEALLGDYGMSIGSGSATGGGNQ